LVARISMLTMPWSRICGSPATRFSLSPRPTLSTSLSPVSAM
jgi:hypothetical protein